MKITDSTPIPFGKLKGLRHSELLTLQHKAYAYWLLDNKNLALTPTVKWLTENQSRIWTRDKHRINYEQLAKEFNTTPDKLPFNEKSMNRICGHL